MAETWIQTKQAARILGLRTFNVARTLETHGVQPQERPYGRRVFLWWSLDDVERVAAERAARKAEASGTGTARWNWWKTY